MLCINFTQDNQDQRIRLPVAGSARPVEGKVGDPQHGPAVGVGDGRLRTRENEGEGGETLVYMAVSGGAR